MNERESFESAIAALQIEHDEWAAKQQDRPNGVATVLMNHAQKTAQNLLSGLPLRSVCIAALAVAREPLPF